MCDPDQQPGTPSGAPDFDQPAGLPASGVSAAPGSVDSAAPGSVDEAIGMVLAGFDWLARADLAAVPAVVQADCLRGLERVKSVQTAAHASVLSAFDAGRGFEDDGHGTARAWLRWQTRVTGAAAAGAAGWMRRLRGHRAVAGALAAGQVSASWAREICDWTDRLPEEAREDADRILLGAAAGGADLADLAGLAEQLRRRLASPDSDDDDDGFEDRRLRLQTTLGGVGRLDGDLTSGCARALQAVLDALGKKAGPEDTRTQPQRHHDALAEACRRLIAAGCIPDRAGQPTQIQLQISLEELVRRTGDSTPGPAAAPGEECDAAIVPIVTGHVDHDLLGKLTSGLTGTSRDRAAVRDLILANAVALLSGPHGLASYLRTGTLAGPASSVSLPLDTGTSTETIPPHLRRAVIVRDKHCAAPGCVQPPAACQVHHITPRSQGGPTALTNLLLLCSFHHLILVHRWGWTITLHPDGTTTMTSPDGRVYHSHSPPATTVA